MSLSSLNLIGQSVFELESRNENVDGQTDVGHINLIGGLVTHTRLKIIKERSRPDTHTRESTCGLVYICKTKEIVNRKIVIKC